MDSYRRTNNNRLMFVTATAGTYYPTAVALGLSGATLKAASDTASTTQANSAFAGTPTTVADAKKVAVIKKITVVTAIAGNVTIEGHAGTAIFPVLLSATAGVIWESFLGIPLSGGFRVVTSANAGLLIEYEFLVP